MPCHAPPLQKSAPRAAAHNSAPRREAAVPTAGPAGGIVQRTGEPGGAIAAYARARAGRVATPAGPPVVQRMIRVGGQERTWQGWQNELDPDNTDAARRVALADVLQRLDGQTFATVKDFLSVTAAGTAPLEKHYRDLMVAQAERQRAAQAQLADQQQAPVLAPQQQQQQAAAAAPAAQQDDDRDPDDAPADDESFFPSRKAAFEYLAEKTSYTMEQLVAFADFKPSVFAFLTKDIGPADIQLKKWKRTLASLEYLFDNQPAVGTGKKSKGDWALSPIRKAALDVVSASKDNKLFPGGAYTVHHKVSRFKLRGLHTAMTKAPGAAAKLSKVLHATVPSTTSDLNALLNIPGNLEVGPQARVADPGSGFDPSYEDGAMTPRSQTLSEVDTLISRPAIDFDEVAKRLMLLHKQQQEALKKRGGTLITMPVKSQWTPGGNNKFNRG